MYMGQSHCVFHRDGWEQLRLYKHIDTRRYLNVAEDGTCFRYSEGGYTPISAEVAIEHASDSRRTKGFAPERTRKKERRNTMAKSVNKVILLGHVGKDPEVGSTTGGTTYARGAEIVRDYTHAESA
jgi:hypothetical protein